MVSQPHFYNSRCLINLRWRMECARGTKLTVKFYSAVNHINHINHISHISHSGSTVYSSIIHATIRRLVHRYAVCELGEQYIQSCVVCKLL